MQTIGRGVQNEVNHVQTSYVDVPKEVSVSLWREDPIQHTQPAFKYQQKCFKRIRQSYAELPADDKEKAKKLFDGTDCGRFLE